MPYQFRIRWECADVISRFAKRLADRQDAARRVEAHGIADAAALGRVIGQDAGDRPLMRRLAAQARPGASEIGDIGDAIAHRGMGNTRELETLAALRLALEGNGAAEDTPVDLRQNDIHREIGGGKAARCAGPLLLRRARQYDLQHRRIRGVENADAFIDARGKGGSIEDDVEPSLRQEARERRRDLRVLEACDINACDVHAARRQSLRQCVDRRRIRRHQDRAIEDDQRAGASLARFAAAAVIEAERRHAARRLAPATRRAQLGAMNCRQAERLSGPPSSK